MMARLKVREVTPTIVGLQEQLEQIRAGEIEKARRRSGAFTPEQEEAIEAHHPRHHEQDRPRPHLRAAQPRRTPRRRARHRSHQKGVSSPGLIHAGNRIARFAACAVAGPLGGAAANGCWARHAASRSSRPPATRSPMCRWPRSGRKGLFTKEIEEALLDGRADLAVHSLKDLPTELPDGPGAGRGAGARRPARRHRRRRLADLPQGRKVGTSSLRRAAQLRSCVRTSRSNRCAAISTRACASSTRAVTTPSCWPPPACSAWAGRIASRKSWSRR